MQSAPKLSSIMKSLTGKSEKILSDEIVTDLASLGSSIGGAVGVASEHLALNEQEVASVKKFESVITEAGRAFGGDGCCAHLFWAAIRHRDI